MVQGIFKFKAALRLSIVLGCALLVSGCAAPRQMNMFDTALTSSQPQTPQLSKAIRNAKAVKAQGKRLWCVPFARDASGVDIRGNAGTWWRQAHNTYARGHDPLVGSVIAFKATRKLPMGHVAVVSQVLSDREILVDHANWSRSKISLGMKVIDVSAKGDWSAVRVASNGEDLGRVYPVDGFIWSSHLQ
ncbi:CHAP domain-containing protein [Cypionkella sp.]|jgi:surface antigen|uniref:CHAP domain-containing protein n=1 Tax=Cypionkella sp. TaxID=2811411 RepID=UPI0037526D1E